MTKIGHFINRELIITFHKKFDLSSQEGRSLERRRRIALTSFTSIILKLLSMSIPLITIQITYKYLGVEIYGLWSTVTTFFTMFAFSDLGLGNGLQTKLSQANGLEDISLSRKIITNTYALLLLVAILLLTVFLISFKFINWSTLMNAKTEDVRLFVNGVVFAVVLPNIIAIPFAIIQRTQLALQEGYKSNIWSIIGYIISLISIYVIAKLDLGGLFLIFVSSFIPVIVSLLNMLIYFYHDKVELRFSYKLLDLPLIRSLLNLGIFFFILSVFTTIGLSMDTFIVAKTSNLTEAASYSILFKVSTILTGVLTVFSVPLWGANGEAIARKDYSWVKNNTIRMSKLMVILATLVSIIIILSAKWIFKIWLGNDFVFSFVVLIGMCGMQVLFSFISPYFMVLNALGKVKIQVVLFALYTPISFFFKYFLSIKFGISVIPWVGFMCYFIFIVIGIFIYTRKKIAFYF